MSAVGCHQECSHGVSENPSRDVTVGDRTVSSMDRSDTRGTFIGGLRPKEWEMRIARNFRDLLATEITEADKVFGDSLPAYRKIQITDALGPLPTLDNPYTDELMSGMLYTINVGPEIYADLTRGKTLSGYGIDRNIFIHEMTHVWQYYHGYSVILGSAWANTFGAGYTYTNGQAWGSYNVEQQAQLVEDWYNAKIGNLSRVDLRFVYIDKIIRPGLDAPSFFHKRIKELIMLKLTAAELRAL